MTIPHCPKCGTAMNVLERTLHPENMRDAAIAHQLGIGLPAFGSLQYCTRCGHSKETWKPLDEHHTISDKEGV